MRIDDSMLAFAGDLAQCGGEVTDLGNCKIVRSSISFLAYSGVFCQRFGDRAEEQARDVRSRMKEMSTPPMWQVFSGATPSDLVARLIALGADRIVEAVLLE